MRFGELAQRIEGIGSRLGTWGIRRGDVLAWVAAGRAQTAAALAIVPVSATLAPLSPGLTAEAYQALLDRLRPKAVVCPGGVEHAIARAARNLGIAEIAVVPDRQGVAGAFDLELAHPRASLEATPLVAPETTYVATTSGTTGRPKLVPLGGPQIMVNAREHGALLAIGPADVSGHLTPLHVTAGIRTTYLHALLNGAAVDCLPEADIDALLAAVERDEITYASISFTLLRELLRRVESGTRFKSGRLRFLRAASGRVEPDELDRLETALGVPVITGLASAETGTLAEQRLPPAQRNRGSVGPPLGVDIRLVDESGRVVAPGECGEIQVRGAQVFEGYLADPELNAQSFVDGWFRMGDLGRFDAEGELHVVGRIKEIINRGGEKISPVEIDAALRALPGVVDAAAFGIPHPSLGEELVAAVVRRPDSELDAQTTIARLRVQLGPRRAPRHVWFVEALPRNETGKVLRAALPEWVGHTAASSRGTHGAAVASRSPVEIALAGLWANALGLAQVARDDNFFMLGGDSLRGMQLLSEVSAVFGVAIPLAALFDNAATLAKMASRIEAERTQSARGTGEPTIPR